MPRTRRGKLRRTWPQRLLIAFNVMLVLVCLGSAAALTYTKREFSAVPRVSFGGDVLAEPQGSTEPQNILLVGVDDGSGLPGNDTVRIGRGQTLNTDTIMILRVDPSSEQAMLLSLPRDLWIPIADSRSKGRINSAMALGGPERLIQTIQQDFGIPIHHYVQVDFAGFKQLVAAIDGVPVYFPWKARDWDPSIGATHSGLEVDQTGCVTLDPDQALALARSRYFQIDDGSGWKADPSSDHGRIARQQEFMKAALKRAIARGVRNPFTLSQLVKVAQQNVTLDSQFTFQDIVDLGTQFKDFNPDSLQVFTPPTTGGYAGAAAVLFLDDKAAQPMFDLFRGIDAGSPQSVRVEVRNGSGTSGQGKAVLDALAAKGFLPVRSTDASTFGVQSTQIHYAPGSEREAVEVARYIDGNVQFQQDTSLPSDVSVAVVTGVNFTSVLDQPRPVEDFDSFMATTTTTTAPPGDTTTLPPDSPEVSGYVPLPPPGTSCG